MFCPSCGTESLPDQKFCKNCGATLRAAGDAPTVPAAAAAPTPQAVPPPAQAPVQYVPPQAQGVYPPAAAQAQYPPMPVAYPPPPPGYVPYPLIAPPAPKSSTLRTVVTTVVVLVALGAGAVYYFNKGGTVTIGTKDQVVYSGTATQAEATALGNRLKADNYFQDRGVTVLLHMGKSGTRISYVVQDGAWNDPTMVSDFEIITRDVATTVGGLPVDMRLVNSTQIVEKDEVITAQAGTGTGTSSTVTIGTKDEVIYSGTATQDQATALGNALKTDGYFQDRGVTVLLDMGAGGTTISFVVQDGYWNQAGALSSFEEVVREVASSVGGLPVKLQLMDTKQDVEKTSTVGEAQFTGGDAVYYEGNATLAQAQALGQQLQSLGYFTGKGVNVFLVRHDDGTTLAFVVADGAWNDASMVSAFETLTRGVATTIGGLPIEMHLVNTTLVVEKDETIQ